MRKVTAYTELIEDKDFSKSRLVLSYEGNNWGGCQHINIPQEDPADVLKEIVNTHNRTFPDEAVDIVILNGKKISLTDNTLNRFF